jgi:hypothetical protein
VRRLRVRPRQPGSREASGPRPTGTIDPCARSIAGRRRRKSAFASAARGQQEAKASCQNAAVERREARRPSQGRHAPKGVVWLDAPRGAPPPSHICARRRSEGAPGADQRIRAAERWLFSHRKEEGDARAAYSASWPGLSRPSTSSCGQPSKTCMPGTRPGMTNYSGLAPLSGMPATKAGMTNETHWLV